MPKARTRNFAFIVYPDSAVPDWKDRLSKESVPAYISPLHDRDLLEDGTPKKPHWHVLITYAGVKSRQQTEELLGRVLGPLANQHIEVVNSTKGYARYLCHLDDPDKAQYNAQDVTVLGGAEPYLDFSRTEKETAEAEEKTFLEIVSYIVDNDFCYYHDFLLTIGTTHPDWRHLVLRKFSKATSDVFKSISAKRKAPVLAKHKEL